MKSVTLALACALAPAGLAAQDGLVHATIDSGTLVRMHPAAGAPFRGCLVQPLAPSSTFIQLCRNPGPACADPSDTSAVRRVPTASLIGLDVQHGTKWASGACGARSSGSPQGSWSAKSWEASVEYAAIGAVTFGVIGGFIGSGKPTWSPAP